MKPLTTLPEAMQNSIPHEVMEKLKASLAATEAGLLNQDPELKNHLRESHRLLISYPETVHLLDDEEIAKLIDAQEKLTQVQIVSDVAKSKKGKKAIGTVDDL